MKAVKRNLENLKKVADSIISVLFSNCVFEIDYYLATANVIRLVSVGCDGIGFSILSMIPSNYLYRVSFVNGNLYLTIWYR